MGLFTIDESKCTMDGICAAECPVRIITEPDDRRFPAPVENAEELCIECGHCVAVCPHEAFSHRALGPDECEPIRKDLEIHPDQAEQFLASRRSIRSYRDKPVERETIERLIGMCRNAPTGHNSRLTEWMVVRDAADVRRYAGMTVDWMRFMLKEHPAIVEGLHMDLVVKAWEEGADRVCRGAPHLIL
ncbi:MAG: ferridoxin, partial [Chrysiogenales bacterium]